MSYYFTVFLCSLSQYLRNVKNWLILLLLPIIIIGTNCLTETEPSAPVTVGVVLPESGTDELWALLSGHNSDILTFVVADTDTIDRNVAAGEWDCGLVFAEDFEELLDKQDLDGSVTLRIGPGSAVYPLVQETVSACLAQLSAPVIARAFLSDNGIANPENSRQMEQKLEDIQAETQRVGVTLTTLDGSKLQVPELTERGIHLFLFWLISSVILVRMLFGAADLGKWIESAAVKRMLAIQPRLRMMTARISAEGFPMILSGCCAMLLLRGSGWACLAVLGYTLFLMSLSVFLAQFPQVHGALPVCLPFAVVMSFLLSSVLADVSLILPALSGISQWLPTSLFLRTCNGDPVALSVLFADCLLCSFASCIVCSIHQNSFPKHITSQKRW